MGRWPRFAAAGFAALLLTGGAAYAVGSSHSSGTITVCVSHKTGALYKSGKCASRDKKLSWNERGPAGVVGALGQLDGIPCTMPEGSAAGTTKFTINDAGSTSLTCVPNVVATHPFASPQAIGSIGCGAHVTLSNQSISAPGDEEWISTASICGSGMEIQLTGAAGIVFDVVDAKGNALQSGKTDATVPVSSDPVLVVVYGGPGVSGSYSIQFNGAD